MNITRGSQKVLSYYYFQNSSTNGRLFASDLFQVWLNNF